MLSFLFIIIAFAFALSILFTLILIGLDTLKDIIPISDDEKIERAINKNRPKGSPKLKWYGNENDPIIREQLIRDGIL
jgi:hypothetical protein